MIIHFFFYLPSLQAAFSRGIDVAGHQNELRKFFTSRLANVSPYIIITGRRGRKNENDIWCVIMEMVRVVISDFSINEALCVLQLMRKGLKVTYSTFRKRTEANDIHHFYYPENEKTKHRKVNWTTANKEHAPSVGEWRTHMEMFLKVVVAVCTAYEISLDEAIEMACEAIATLDTLNPKNVERQSGERKNTRQEEVATVETATGNKRSRVDGAQLETPLDVPTCTRNVRTRRTTDSSPAVHDHIMDLDTSPAGNNAVPASVPSASASALTAAEEETFFKLFEKEVKVEVQGALDNYVLSGTLVQREDILLSSPDSYDLRFLEDLKVYEIKSIDNNEPAAQMAPTPAALPAAPAAEQQNLDQENSSESSLDDEKFTWEDLNNLELDDNGNLVIETREEKNE